VTHAVARVFHLCSAESGGKSLSSENHNGVAMTSGLGSVLLDVERFNSPA
jgi:hypothetical protein